MDKLQVFFPNSWVFFVPKLFPFWIFLQFSSQFHNLYHQTLIFTWKRVNVSPVIYHRKTRSLSWSRTRGLTGTDPLSRVRTNLVNIIHHSLLSSDKIFPCYWRMAGLQSRACSCRIVWLGWLWEYHAELQELCMGLLLSQYLENIHKNIFLKEMKL